MMILISCGFDWECAEEILMRMIAAAIDDGNIDEDEQQEIDEAELQVTASARAHSWLFATQLKFRCHDAVCFYKCVHALARAHVRTHFRYCKCTRAVPWVLT